MRHRDFVLQVGHDATHLGQEFALEILLLGADVDHQRMPFAVAREEVGLLAGQLGLLATQVGHHVRLEDLRHRLGASPG